VSSPPGAPAVVREWITKPPTWVDVRPVPPDGVSMITDDLDHGERAAIVLAEMVHADLLLIDEAAGRAEAKRRQLRVTGTLGVLRSRAEQGLVNVPDLFQRLKATSFYPDETLLNAVFDRWLKPWQARQGEKDCIALPQDGRTAARPASSSRGDISAAAALLAQAPGLGWSSDEHPGHILFPSLAVLLTHMTSRKVSDTLLADLDSTCCDPLEVLSPDDVERRPKLGTPSIATLIQDVSSTITSSKRI
jgi:predicted nucleic acid-binding protein